MILRLFSFWDIFPTHMVTASAIFRNIAKYNMSVLCALKAQLVNQHLNICLISEIMCGIILISIWLSLSFNPLYSSQLQLKDKYSVPILRIDKMIEHRKRRRKTFYLKRICSNELFRGLWISEMSCIDFIHCHVSFANSTENNQNLEALLYVHMELLFTDSYMKQNHCCIFVLYLSIAIDVMFQYFYFLLFFLYSLVWINELDCVIDGKTIQIIDTGERRNTQT